MTLLAYWSFDKIIILWSVVVITAYLYMTRNFNYWRKRGILEIPPTPFLGNFGNCLLKKSPSNLLKDFHNQAKGQPYIGFYIYDKPALLICDPKVVQKILIKDFNYFCDRYGIADEKDRMGYANLFSLENPAWKTVRMKLSPFFTSAKLKNMLSLILQNTKNLEDYLDMLKLEGDGKIINVKSLSGQFTTNVIGSVAFGVKLNAFENPDDELYKNGKEIFFSGIRRKYEIFAIFFLPKLVSLIGIKLFGNESTSFIRKIFWESVNARMQSNQKRHDFIDVMMELKKTYGDQDINGFKFDGDDLVAQTASFFSAGSDLTSLPITFALYELAMNPEIQSKLRNEILENLNESDGNITYQMLASEMPYLDMVLSEVLRLYPPLGLLDRQTMNDYKISDTDVIQKGTPIFISTLGFHYDPKYFPEPDKFDPERFNEKNKRNIPLYAYFPFGEGPHICIGIRFALLIIKLMLVTVLKKYEVLVCEKTPIPIVFEPKAVMSLPLKDMLHLNMRRIENIKVK